MLIIICTLAILIYILYRITNTTPTTPTTPTGTITLRELAQVLDQAFGGGVAVPADDREATWEDFLEGLCEAAGNRVIHRNGGSWVYPAGDSAFLSADDWAYIQRNIHGPAEPALVERVSTQVGRFLRYCESHQSFATLQGFTGITRTCFPEYHPITAAHTDAVKTWLQALGNKSEDFSYYGDIIHEVLHERSARRAGAFRRRQVKGGSWQVIFSGNPGRWDYLNPDTGNWVTVIPANLPRSAQLLTPSYAASIRNTSWYRLYIDQDMLSNRHGLYGILQEMSAQMANLRVAALATSFGFRYQYIPQYELRQYYFWRGCLLGYLAQLERRNRLAYMSILGNQSLVRLMHDLLQFGDRQLSWGLPIQEMSPETKAIQAWANTPDARTQYSAIARKVCRPVSGGGYMGAGQEPVAGLAGF